MGRPKPGDIVRTIEGRKDELKGVGEVVQDGGKRILVRMVDGTLKWLSPRRVKKERQ